MDPIEVDNEQENQRRDMLAQIIAEISPELSFHDLRSVSGETHTNLIFDIVAPFGFELSDKEIKERIDSELSERPVKYFTVITFDRIYTE